MVFSWRLNKKSKLFLKEKPFLQSFWKFYLFIKILSFYPFTFPKSITSNLVHTTKWDIFILILFIIFTICHLWICTCDNIFLTSTHYILFDIGNICVTLVGTLLAILHCSILYLKRMSFWCMFQLINSVDIEVLFILFI